MARLSPPGIIASQAAVLAKDAVGFCAHVEVSGDTIVDICWADIEEAIVIGCVEGRAFLGDALEEVLVDVLAQVIVLARYGPKDIGLADGGASLGYLADSLLYGVGGSHGQSRCQQYDDD